MRSPLQSYPLTAGVFIWSIVLPILFLETYPTLILINPALPATLLENLSARSKASRRWEFDVRQTTLTIDVAQLVQQAKPYRPELVSGSLRDLCNVYVSESARNFKEASPIRRRRVSGAQFLNLPRPSEPPSLPARFAPLLPPDRFGSRTI